MKHAGETQSVVRAVDETIANLTQMRPILADPVMLALIKKIVGNPASSIRAEAHSPNASTRPYGGTVRAAFDIVEDIGDEPFSACDLADRMRKTGYEIKNPKNNLFYPIQRLLADGIIKLIQHGGGNRPNVYQKVQASYTEENSRRIERTEGNEIGTSGPAIPRQLRPRNEMERVAFECIARSTRPFATHELISDMMASGFTFVGNADLSIQPALKKLVKERILEITKEGAGEWPTIYLRRNTE